MELLSRLDIDTRFALRSLRKNPGFTLLAVLVMALGIGANTAMFSVVNAVLLKPLEFSDPDRIVSLSNVWTKDGTRGPISEPDFRDWHEQATAFSAMAYYVAYTTAVTGPAGPEYRTVTRVAPEFFPALGVRPAIGRLFNAEESKPGSGAAAVVSHAYWLNQLGGDPNAVGQTVRMFDRSLNIVGVMPPRFHFPDKTDLWIPTNTIIADTTGYRSAHNYLCVARLKSDVTLEQAQSQMTAIGARLEQQYPDSNIGKSVVVTRMRDAMVRDVRLTLNLLLGAVGVVLLIACANVATLLLAKATARAREIAIRAAVGASAGRIVRQLITESLALAFVAGAAGLILAIWGSAAMVALAPANVPRLAETGVDLRVLAFTFGVSVAASLLFGLAPAIQAARVDLADALKLSGGRAVVGGRAGRMRNALVVAEIAFSVILLAGAVLLLRSFVAMHNVDLGFRPERLLVMETSVPAADMTGIKRAVTLSKEILAGVAALPGVLAAGATRSVPGRVFSNGGYHIDFLPEVRSVTAPQAVTSIVAPGTFATLGIPLKQGRDFNSGDNYEAQFVAVVNEALVKKSFAGKDPIGHTIYWGFDSPKPMTIVGVVGNIRQYGPAREPQPEIYAPYEQHPGAATALRVLVRTATDPNALTEAMRQITHQRAPDVPVRFTTMEASLAENVATPRFRTLLLGAFALLAVCLAMAGVYGVMAYAVGQRINEIGLRIALGAAQGDVLRLILRQGLTLAAAGVTLGLAGAVATSRLLTTMLFEVKPTDPATYAAVALALVMAMLAASYLPARRATKVDPLIALRQE